VTRALVEGFGALPLLVILARQVIRFVEHLEVAAWGWKASGRSGLEGIGSKRTDAPYRSGPSRTWLKSKNPASDAVGGEREEDWR
jgi:ATP-dependent DNA ligase